MNPPPATVRAPTSATELCLSAQGPLGAIHSLLGRAARSWQQRRRASSRWARGRAFFGELCDVDDSLTNR